MWPPCNGQSRKSTWVGGWHLWILLTVPQYTSQHRISDIVCWVHVPLHKLNINNENNEVAHQQREQSLRCQFVLLELIPEEFCSHAFFQQRVHGAFPLISPKMERGVFFPCSHGLIKTLQVYTALQEALPEPALNSPCVPVCSGAALGPLLAGLISPSGWTNVFYMLMVADACALLVSLLSFHSTNPSELLCGCWPDLAKHPEDSSGPHPLSACGPRLLLSLRKHIVRNRCRCLVLCGFRKNVKRPQARSSVALGPAWHVCNRASQSCSFHIIKRVTMALRPTQGLEQNVSNTRWCGISQRFVSHSQTPMIINF